MKVLLVEPPRSMKYHTVYPPLGLLKWASYHKKRGDRVRLVRGGDGKGFEPDRIYVTSLFTYAWEPVHDMIRYYRKVYPRAQLGVGGIYATLCPEKIIEEFGNSVRIQHGLVQKLEGVRPDYSFVPEWDASILFSSRGCVRRCHFCAVSKLEPEFKALRTIKDLIYRKHQRIVFWDNNILASPYWKDIFEELAELQKPVDFNQGLDCRLLTQEVLDSMKRFRVPMVRLAYDTTGIRNSLLKAINLLQVNGYRHDRIIVYCLYNFKDTPQDFFERVRDLLEWKVVAYPMRYEPLRAEAKNTYVAPSWTAKKLEMVSRARRVIGFGGAFPSYEGLRKKFSRARSFHSAFYLRPKQNN